MRKNLYIILLVLIGVDAVAIASSNAKEGTGLPGFALPSLRQGGGKEHNISCIVLQKTKTLLCDIHDHAWKDWGTGQQWGSIGTRFMLPQQGPAQAIRSSDEITGGNILNYGSSIEFSSITCKSEKIGLTCTNKSGGMMHLNRDFYVLNKPISSIPK